MRLTLRVENDNYIEVNINLKERTVEFISPIPDLTEKQLFRLCDKFHFRMLLPITEEQITPDDNRLTIEEIKERYTRSTYDVLFNLLAVCNFIISEH